MDPIPTLNQSMRDQIRGTRTYHDDVLLRVDSSQGGPRNTRSRGHEGEDRGGQEGKDGEAQVHRGCARLVGDLFGVWLWCCGVERGCLRIHLKYGRREGEAMQDAALLPHDGPTRETQTLPHNKSSKRRAAACRACLGDACEAYVVSGTAPVSESMSRRCYSC